MMSRSPRVSATLLPLLVLLSELRASHADFLKGLGKLDPGKVVKTIAQGEPKNLGKEVRNAGNAIAHVSKDVDGSKALGAVVQAGKAVDGSKALGAVLKAGQAATQLTGNDPHNEGAEEPRVDQAIPSNGTEPTAAAAAAAEAAATPAPAETLTHSHAAGG